MKDKEKQIVEMAKDFKSYLPSAWYNDKCVNGEVYSMVKHAYEDNYRKIPEDSVVLSREEYEKLKTDNEVLGVELERTSTLLVNAIKETAEKILDYFDKYAGTGKKLIGNMISEQRKKYGVEIKE